MDVICNFKGECSYKSDINNVCKYLTSDLPHYYLYHLGEEKAPACGLPLNNITKENQEGI